MQLHRHRSGALFMIIVACFILWLFTAGQSSEVASAEADLSVGELQQDLIFLRNKIEKKHPNLYLYTPKQQMDAAFDSIYNAIDKPMSTLQFYELITTLYPKLKDGHTVFLPPAELTDMYNANAVFFPFDIFWSQGKMHITANCSADTTLKEGDELLSVNGLAVNDIIGNMLSHQVRDGYSETYPIWITNKWFREYYSYSYAHPEYFKIEYVHHNNKEKITCRGLSKDSIRYYRNIRYSKQIAENAKKRAIFMHMETQQTAVLTILSFNNSLLKKNYHQDFKKSIDSVFEEIEKQHVQNLIIDIRDNQGGDAVNGKLLLSHLLDSAFTLVYKGPSSGSHKPAKHNYKGQVYLLINGGSFSMSGMVAACLRRTNRAVLIGQETGGNGILLSGNPHSFRLPNSHITCDIATRSWQVQDKPNEGHGIMPHYTVVPDIEDKLTGRDAEKIFALGLISKAINK